MSNYASEGEVLDTLRLARIARRANDRDKAESLLGELDGQQQGGDIALERALAAFSVGEHQQMLRLLLGIEEKHPRAAEARYHLGLAQYHLERRTGAASSSAPPGRSACWAGTATWAWTIRI